jgi:transposase InsO family protein
LRREGWPVNRKRVGRLMHSMGLQLKATRKTQNTTDSTHSFPRSSHLSLCTLTEK